MKLKCNKCKNEWDYNGDNPYYATCTRCLQKVKVPANSDGGGG